MFTLDELGDDHVGIKRLIEFMSESAFHHVGRGIDFLLLLSLYPTNESLL
jgi:hypothetical protein